jgi:hypothetical protein
MPPPGPANRPFAETSAVTPAPIQALFRARSDTAEGSTGFIMSRTMMTVPSGITRSPRNTNSTTVCLNGSGLEATKAVPPQEFELPLIVGLGQDRSMTISPAKAMGEANDNDKSAASLGVKRAVAGCMVFSLVGECYRLGRRHSCGPHPPGAAGRTL